MTISFPQRLSLAQLPTPFTKLSRISDKYGVNIWIKRDDLTGCALSGNKIRKLEFTLAKARAEGCDALITCGGLQSNHCRATALLGAQLGMEVHLVLRGEQDLSQAKDGNLLLDELAGAHIHCFPVKEFAAKLEELLQQQARQLVAEGKKPWIIPTGASDGLGVWGYLHACRELKADFEKENIQPQAIVCATGSGGTQAGLTLGNYLFDLNTQVVGMAVCDNEAWFQNKVREDIQQWQGKGGVTVDADQMGITVNDQYIGPGYGKAGAEVFDCIKEVASLEGVILDPVYTAKAFYGMLQEIKKGTWIPGDDIVFIHTGGIFGLFPQRDFV
ncbi:MAG: D-cysteine desulfhydrase family protein [Cellvibrionaceae bacterium]